MKAAPGRRNALIQNKHQALRISKNSGLAARHRMDVEMGLRVGRTAQESLNSANFHTKSNKISSIGQNMTIYIEVRLILEFR
jgi:hypothetical protein